MDDERARQLARESEDEVLQWAQDAPVIGAGGASTGQATIALVADEFRRRGVPVVNARMEGDAIVFDVATPRGMG